MWSWLPDALNAESAPAWVQAVGSIVAILVAVAVPWRQRKLMIADVRREEIRREKDFFRRLTSALSVEINEAVAASGRQQEAVRAAIGTLTEAKAKSLPIVDCGPLRSWPPSGKSGYPGDKILRDRKRTQPYW